jgi:regulator of replication initiation timing
MLEIKNSLDWPKTDTELQKLGNMLPMFKADIKRIRNHIGSMVTELSKMEILVRSTRSRSAADNCSKQVEKINLELRQIQKFHLMSVMSNS